MAVGTEDGERGATRERATRERGTHTSKRGRPEVADLNPVCVRKEEVVRLQVEVQVIGRVDAVQAGHEAFGYQPDLVHNHRESVVCVVIKEVAQSSLVASSEES